VIFGVQGAPLLINVQRVVFGDARDDAVVTVKKKETCKACLKLSMPHCLKLCKRGPHSQTTVDDTTASTLPLAPKEREKDRREKDPRAVEQHAKEPRRAATSVDSTEKGVWETALFCYYRCICSSYLSGSYNFWFQIMIFIYSDEIL
jgi:hypothetical protein